MARRPRRADHSDPLSIPSIARRLGPIGALLAATLLAYRELLSPSWVLADYDAWTYFYPLRAYAARAVREGRWPLWNPDTFLGAPFFANPQTSMLYPGTALFYLLPLAYAYSLSIIVHVFLAGVFTYAFARSAWGVRRVAAFIGAAGFAFGGFLSSQVGHINQMSASAWLPAIALCADRAARTRDPRWALGGAVALAIQLLAGHAQESYMTVWVVALLLLWRGTIGAAPGSSTRALGGAGPDHWSPRTLGASIWVGAVVVVLGFGLAAIQLLPTAELSAASIRGGGMTDAEAVSFSLPPPSLVRSLMPGYWFNLPSEELGYIGGVGLSFAALALLFGRWRPTICAAGLAAFGLFLALGGANPLYVPLLHHVPGLALFRVPSRWLFVYTFGAAGLAALGADWALRQPSPASVEGMPSPTHGFRWRVALLGAFLALAAMVATPSIAAVHGRIAALWVGALAIPVAGAWIARRWPSAIIGVLLTAVLLGELMWAAMDLPQRYPAPAMVMDSHRAVPTYLAERHAGERILSVAPTEYRLEDEDQLLQRYPGLAPGAVFAFTSALKLDEVMSPNVPLRYGLSTLDGYDGGVLPLRRFLQVASLLAPADELRADGVVRTRLIAVPEARLLKLFDVRAVIANGAFDVDVAGVHFDVATARALGDGQSLRVDLATPSVAQGISILGSIDGQSDRPGEGRMVVTHSDGLREDVPLRVGERVFPATAPGPDSAPQPTAGLSRGGRRDTAVRIPLNPASPVRSIQLEWTGSGAWSVRAATLIRADGTQDQLVLDAGLNRITFPILKVYEPVDRRSAIPLVPDAEVASDDDALRRLSAAPSGDLDRIVYLAPETGNPPAAIGSGRGQGTATFRRRSGRPERLEFERAEGGGGGFLVVDDAWFPGWNAEVDGRPTPLYRADVDFKAVYVPPGAERVTLTYEPASVRWGAAATALTALTMVLLWVFAGRSRRQGQDASA